MYMTFEHPHKKEDADAEMRMQKEYITPITHSLNDIMAAVTDLEQRPRLKDALEQLYWDYDEVPMAQMDEGELAADKSGWESVRESVLQPEITNETREQIIIAYLER
jgi:hypothetical protein